MSDYQKDKVYAWERKWIAPKDKHVVPFDQLQRIVNYVWDEEGLKFPPIVQEKKSTATALASANHSNIFAPKEGIPTWVLIHEMSHSMTMNIEGDGYLHNENFMGVYLRLLSKYLYIEMPFLLWSCKESGVNVNPTASLVEA